MKHMKYFFIVITFFIGNIAAMAPSSPVKSITTPVQVYFTPQDVEQMRSELDKLLDSAKKRVLMAMYWITDDTIVKKLIDLKNKNVDVQVVFDESSLKFNQDLFDILFKSGISVLVFPSASIDRFGIMHNKFFVVDDAKVWTGSANLTKAAIDPKALIFNDETVFVFDSKPMARKFIVNFRKLQQELLGIYAELLVDNSIKDLLPDWMNVLTTKLKKISDNFIKRIAEKQREQTVSVKQEFKPFAVSPQFEPATKKQEDLLKKLRVFKKGLSKSEASGLISTAIEQKQSAQVGETYESSEEEFEEFLPISSYQRRFLSERGISSRGMSYDDAYEVIGDIKQKEKRQKQYKQQKRSSYYQQSGYKRKSPQRRSQGYRRY